MNTIKQNKNKGFVILMASLLAGLFLIIGASIFQISIKELVLSSGGRDSQYAFYAADSGIECALYLDLKIGNIFATSSESIREASSAYCNYQDLLEYGSWTESSSLDSATTSFRFVLFPEDGAVRSDCVDVIVIKNSGRTLIESRGYNTCNEGSLRRFERGLRITY